MSKKSLSAKIKESGLEDLGGERNGYKMAFHLLNKGFTKDVILISMKALHEQMEKRKIRDPFPYLEAIAIKKTTNVNAHIAYEDHKKILAQEKAFVKSGGLEKLKINIG